MREEEVPAKNGNKMHTMRKKYKTEAIVIKGRVISERDQIVTFISPVEGKFDAICKGAKKITSHSSGKLESFNRVALFIAAGKSLDVVIQAELLEGFPYIRKSLDKSSSALFILDMINRYVENHEKNPRLFHLLRTSLSMLEKGTDPWLTGIMFQVKFFSIMGYQPDLSGCVVCEKPGDFFYLDYQLGGTVCESCRTNTDKGRGKRISLGTLRALRFIIRSAYSLVSRLNLPPVIKDELKFVVEKYIFYNLPGTPMENHCYDKLTK